MTGTRSEEINLTSKVISKNGENLETLLQLDPNATDAILYREISRVSIPNRPLSEYWNIKTWIRWKDNFKGLNSEDSWKTLEYEVNQIAIQ